MGSCSELSLQLATTILCIPLCPVGKRDACQLNKRSFDMGSLYCCVAFSIISTISSTFLFAGISPAIFIPNFRAIEERTCCASNTSPSISLDWIISCVSVSRFASACNPKPSDSIRPSNFHCCWWRFVSIGKITSWFHWKCGQPVNW